MYVLKKIIFFFRKVKKKYFSEFQSIFRIPVGQRWRWRWRWRWTLSHWKMLRKWNDIVPTYIEATKNSLGNISNEQVFTVDPYFGGTQNLGQPEKHFFDTFFQFRPWRGPKCDQNQLWHVNIMGKLQLGKKIDEESDSPRKMKKINHHGAPRIFKSAQDKDQEGDEGKSKEEKCQTIRFFIPCLKTLGR